MPNSGQIKISQRLVASSSFASRALEFDLERAISSLRKGQPAIPVWLDVIFASVGGKNKGVERSLG